MTIALGIVALAVVGLLYLGQVVSVTNLEFAQRVGLQERPDTVDRVFTSLELWTARWDLLSLWVLPVAGALMVADHSWWPYVAMLGGGLAADTGGREIAKYLGLRQHAVRIGGPREVRQLFGVMALLSIMGVVVAIAGLVEAV
jgi:hypothetical protein